MRKLIAGVFLGLFCSPMQVFALPNDIQQVMHIIADSTIFNYQLGTNVYEGNVKIDQGSTHLTADRVTTHNNTQHKIDEAVAYGIKALAEYTTLPKIGDQPFHAKAKIIRFYPVKSLVILEGDVLVMQGSNSFQGPLITYNMKDQIVTAPPSKTGRATVVIEPGQIK